jgi:hypothetical protein
MVHLVYYSANSLGIVDDVVVVAGLEVVRRHEVAFPKFERREFEGRTRDQ